MSDASFHDQAVCAADVPSGGPHPEKSEPAGNLATGTLKIIAVVFMLIDHLGAAVFPNAEVMRILGRIAFPIYCWCMVVGFHYTHSVPKYLGRLLLTGLLVQPLYAHVMNHMGIGGGLMAFYTAKSNIFLTLFLALAALWGIREKKGFSQIWAPMLSICLATVLKADYGWKGVLFIILLYASSTSRPAIAAVMVSFFLYWGTGYGVTRSLSGLLNTLPGYLSAPLSAFLRLETYGLLALPFLLIRFPRNIHLPTWAGYAIYPAHLLIVWAMKLLIR